MAEKLTKAGVVLCLLLAGCQPPETPPEKYPFSSSIQTYRDLNTGCEYLIARINNGGGITPRLDQNGYPTCRTTARLALENTDDR